MKMQCLSLIGGTAIHILADCVLEFLGGNEIGHLLGVFMRSNVFIFFALSVSDLTHPKPEKVVIKFMEF